MLQIAEKKTSVKINLRVQVIVYMCILTRMFTVCTVCYLYRYV